MVTEPLVVASEMTGFPGAPFPDAVLDSAAGQVRDECGWHIAPVVNETVTLYPAGAITALLPSLSVASVAEVRDAEGVVLEGWKLRGGGVLRRASGWPESIEVDFTHGYATCPPGLLAVIAERAQRIKGGGVKSESLAGRSVALDTAPASTNGDAIARHTIPGRP